jgi:UDPglucose 6-dehydrogenase
MAVKISIVGTGYVGLVSGTTFAAMGNNVWCVDIDQNKLEKMKSGICPIYEPGLETLMQKNIKENRLQFTDDLEKTVMECDVIFLCLPTPPNEDGSADLDHVLNCSKDIAHIIKKNKITHNKIIVDKSTVPVGTSDKVLAIFDSILGEHSVLVCSNPEFLREGFAVEDAMKPDRVVIGTSSDYVKSVMTELYKPFVRSGNPIIFMDEKSAEITKYAANAFLATKISFMNDLARYCEVVGADIENIRMGIGSDTRIGKRFLFPGIGYGGSCFPKDVKAIIYSSRAVGTPLRIVETVKMVNDEQIEYFASKIKTKFPNLQGRKVALWGLSFKPNTDDTREAPAFHLINFLLAEGASIDCYDPEAMYNTKIAFGDKINYHEDMYKCLDDADCLVVCTEWNPFRTPDFDILDNKLKYKVIFDGRNLYDPNEMETLGYEYHCIGRRKK